MGKMTERRKIADRLGNDETQGPTQTGNEVITVMYVGN
jgi:hypothetical protein